MWCTITLKSFVSDAMSLFRRGVYFADKSAYSDCYSYKPPLSSSSALRASSSSISDERPTGVEGEREMFLAKLLVGNEVLMNRDENSQKARECKALTVPPVDPKTNARYNSVTGHTAGSQVWVVYENGRAYPDYLVRYYRGSRDPKRTPFKSKREAAKSAAKKKGAMQEAALEDVDLESGNLGGNSSNDATILWEYLDNDDWKPYGRPHQVALEAAYQSFTVTGFTKSSKVRIKSDEWEYEIDVNAMVQTNTEHITRRQRDVRRRVLDDTSGIDSA